MRSNPFHVIQDSNVTAAENVAFLVKKINNYTSVISNTIHSDAIDVIPPRRINKMISIKNLND